MEKNKEHCKLAVIGNVDSGKSTLVGVLAKGLPDDGRGGARVRVFNYPHQIETGRTSSICHEIMGFDEKHNQVVPERFHPNKNKYWKEVVASSHKIITFFDLCGHEKYLKTTINGLTGLIPDYSMIVVGGNMGVSKMTKEHLGISLFLRIPFMIVLTKVDIAPKNVFEENLNVLQKILKSKLVEKIPIVIKEGTSKEEITKYSELMVGGKICPIFLVSNVTSSGIPELVHFLSYLNNRDQLNSLIKASNEHFEYDINENFVVQGVGVVISGIVKSGSVRVNQQCLLGPDKNKGYRVVVVKSIHINRTVADQALPGQLACLNIRPLKTTEKLVRSEFRKGMVLLDINLKPQPIWEFEAEVQILHHATSVMPNYQAVLHCGVIRQSVTLKKIYQNEDQLLRNEDRGLVKFRFMYNPEYLKVGLTILLREGRTKILGTVTRVFLEKELQIQQSIKKPILEVKTEKIEGQLTKKELRKKNWVQKHEGKKQIEKNIKLEQTIKKQIKE